MKFIFILLTLLMGATPALATPLTPVEFDDRQVDVTAVDSIQNFASKDEAVRGRIVTVYKGTAMSFSDAYLIFADSLEDKNYAFQLKNILGKPENVSVTKRRGVYILEMDVTYIDNMKYVENKRTKVKTLTKTFMLQVQVKNGEYTVEEI